MPVIVAWSRGEFVAAPDFMTIPETMKAMAIDRYGGPSVLSMHSLPVPTPASNEVLIAVNTAGVGGWDAHMREQPSESGHDHFPRILGTDGSGTIAAVGSRVRRLQVGDRVFSYSYENPKGGFYAEYVAVPATSAAPIPQGFDFVQAGACTATSLTALPHSRSIRRRRPSRRSVREGSRRARARHRIRKGRYCLRPPSGRRSGGGRQA
jgi:D-arabinose 1-dehydrogenase-like Zn-dependent alcohol dehydrogenase